MQTAADKRCPTCGWGSKPAGDTGVHVSTSENIYHLNEYELLVTRATPISFPPAGVQIQIVDLLVAPRLVASSPIPYPQCHAFFEGFPWAHGRLLYSRIPPRYSG